MDMLATGVIARAAGVDTPEELGELLRRGRLSVGVAIPSDVERRLHDGRQVAQVMVDGSDAVVQSAAVQGARLPVAGSAPAATWAGAGATPMLPGEGPISVVGFYNPARRSAVNIVPGLIGVILTMTMV